MKRLLSFYSLIAILIAAGTANLHAQNVAVDKGSLTFSTQFGGAAMSQTLSVTSTTGGATSFSASSNANWLTVNGAASTSGTTPSSLTVMANPAGLNPGTYNATVTVFNAANSVPVAVTLTISTIGVSPSSITFGAYTAGNPTVPASQNITLNGVTAFTAAASTVSGGSWLQVTPTSGTSPAVISASINTAIAPGLAVGSYQGKITVTPSGGTTNIAVDIPVAFTVSAAPVIGVAPNPLQFNLQLGGTNNITTQVMTISVAPAQQFGFNLFATVDPNPAGRNWITTNPPNGLTNAQTGLSQVTVGVDTSNLPAGTYTGKINVMTPGGSPAQRDVPVTLRISDVNFPLLNIPATPLSFTYQLGGAAPAAQSVNITATSGSLQYTTAVATATGGNWLAAPANGSTAAPLSISVNPTGLTPGTYTGTVTVTGTIAGSGSQAIPVILRVTNDPMVVTNVGSLSFPFQIGQAIPPAQVLRIASSTGAPLSFTATPTLATCTGAAWLLLNGAAGTPLSGSTDGSVLVSINPAGLPAGTCTGKISIAATVTSTGVAAINSPLDIPVTLYVSATPLLVVNPPQPVNFSVALGAQSAPPQTIGLASTSSAPADQLAYTVTFQTITGGPWLSVNQLSGTTPSNLGLSVTPQFLSAGTYTGTVTVTVTTAGVTNSPVTIPVSLTVTSGSLTLSPSSLTFTSTLGGTAPAAQTVAIGSSGVPLTYTAVAATAVNPTWLSVTPGSGTTGTNGTLTVTANPANLAAGTYNGTVTVSSPGAGNSPATINVSLVVQPGTISAPTTTLTFNQVAGGPAPAAQTIAVSGTPGTLNFTAAPSTNTPWLTVTPASGTTPGSVQVSANAGSLAVGQYTGSVIITSTGAAGSPITVPVVLNVVTGGTLSANPTSLTFAFTTGLTAPAAQSVVASITGATSVPINAQVQATPATPWLQVTPATANSPATFSVSVTPGSLAPGTYTGAINITSPNSLTALNIPVTLNIVSIPKPVVNAIGNAASYSTGSISPGENIVIFGTGVGPATLVSGTVTGAVLGNTAGSTRVLFDGIAAPVLYASATQTSVLVPYGLNGRTTTNVVVEYSGVASTAIAYNVVPAAPGIYTLNQQGTGPGAVVNENGTTVNGSATPAAKGSVISVYMTGEGQTTPAGSDGAIIPPVASALKNPVLPVTATINGAPATVLYAGSAPGFVSGAMQVNIRIPADAATGAAIPLVVRIGTASSQAGVTIAVQ